MRRGAHAAVGTRKSNHMRPVIIFDIETGPLPVDQIDIPPFDESEVKVGNIKDPAKIAAKVEAARAAHRQSVIDNAALDALTGRVLMVGYKLVDGEFCWEASISDERSVISRWWDAMNQFDRMPLIVGFNSKPFDLPFLIRRSWALGIPVPGWLRQGRFWHDSVVDLREMWQLGDNRARGSLDAVARHLGLGGKSGSGERFHELLATDPQAAIAYCRRDVELTEAIWKRLTGGF